MNLTIPVVMDYKNTDRENKYLRAKDRVAEIKKFYNGLLFYFIFIGFMAYLNYYTNGWSYMWFFWPAAGWGIGILFQAAKAFRWAPFMNKDWEERKIREFMEQDDETSNNRWS